MLFINLQFLLERLKPPAVYPCRRRKSSPELEGFRRPSTIPRMACLKALGSYIILGTILKTRESTPSFLVGVAPTRLILSPLVCEGDNSEHFRFVC